MSRESFYEEEELPVIPNGFRHLKPHEIKRQGDEFWTGARWQFCSMFGDAVGTLNFVIRPINAKDSRYVPIKDRIKKYLEKTKNKK